MKLFKSLGCLLALLLAAIILLPSRAMAADVAINETNFPDDHFREYVSDKIDDGNGVLSQSEIDAVTEMSLSYRQCEDLTGIEYFTNLERLTCSYQYLKELDLSKNTKLRTLDCKSNELTKLILPAGSGLQDINCENNKLKTLNVSKMTGLYYLGCDENELTKLDVSKCTRIRYVSCYNNQLTSLKLPEGELELTYIDCSGNPGLESVDLSNCPELIAAKCQKCALTKLDLSKSTQLEVLYCFDNNIKQLDIHHIPSLLLAYLDEYNEVKKYSSYTYYSLDVTDNLEFDDEEYYELMVDNSTKIATAKPTVSTQPKSQTIVPGKKVTFKVTAKGGGLSYQWQYKKPGGSWTNVSSSAGKKASYSFTVAARHYKYQYRCKVTNAAGYKYSKAATLTVKTKPVITSPTKATTKTVKKGATVKLTVKADAAASYQWQYKKPGSTKWLNFKTDAGKKATYTFKATLTKKGYKYRCKVTNPYGTVISKTITLKVTS